MEIERLQSRAGYATWRGSVWASFLLAAGSAACTSSEAGEGLPDGALTSPVVPHDGATPTTAGDAAVVVGPSAPGADGAVGPVTPGAGNADGPWCKAKAVLDAKCVSCHDGKGTAGAPMSLASFADLTVAAVGKPGAKVYERVAVRVHAERAAAEGLSTMPAKQPLSASELAAIDGWIAAGATAGSNPSCVGGAVPGVDGGVPPAPTWPPAECDAVYKILAHGTGGLDTPYMVAAGQEIHPQTKVDAPWGSEPVQAIAFKPVTDNSKVLHHWILYASSGAFLTGWAPGDDDRPVMPADVGMDMPTGASSLRLDMHYFNVNGTKAEPDKSGLEVCVVKKAHFRKNSAAVTMSFASLGPVLAPANSVNHEATGTCRVTTTQPVHLLTASPHAHTYATHMKFTLKKKDGTEIVMHDQPFRFGEQGSYGLNPEVVIETGDTVYTTCSYTNNTAKNITFGESTTNEMCFNFAVYYPKGALSCGGGGILGGGLGN